MFDPKKAAKFFGRGFVLLGPLLFLLLALGVTTELLGRLDRSLILFSSKAFWLAVGRDMLPGVAALLGTYLLAARFVQALYGMGSFADARSFIHHRLFGLFKFGPWLLVREGKVEGGAEHILNQVGGRGQLVIYNDSAVILQHAGRFTHVHDSSKFAKLEAFEKVYDAVDLRPLRRVSAVDAMSQEGIPVVCEADIRFQLESDGRRPVEALPFPVSGAQVFRAVASRWVGEADWAGKRDSLDWSERLVAEAEVILRSILARYRLDQLVSMAPGTDDTVREKVRREFESRLNSAAARVGACVLKVELGDIWVKDEVTQQWIDYWKARWESVALERQAAGRAESIVEVEDAKTAAQVLMIQNLTGVLKSLASGADAVTSKIVLARLCMALSRTTTDPLTRVYLPQEAVRTLRELKRLVL